jgi:chloramphenicol-sensitive protein RarD
LFFTKRMGKIKEAFKDKKSIVFIMLASVLIGINWFVYIWAVNSNHIVESSMGYYINPLMSVLLGMLVLKERMNLWQYVALILAAAGVASIAIQYGSIPWVAIVLSVSFALYGLCKKMIKVESAVGLALETLMLAPFAFIFLVFKQVQGTSAFLNSTWLVTLLLFCSGIATATPLLWFAKGAKRVELSTIGFLQYISPSISLILGITIFKEQFSKAHIISFSFIWAGLAIYTLSQLGVFKRFTVKSKKVSQAEG